VVRQTTETAISSKDFRIGICDRNLLQTYDAKLKLNYDFMASFGTLIKMLSDNLRFNFKNMIKLVFRVLYEIFKYTLRI